MITNTKQYEATLELFHLLEFLSVKQAFEASVECEDSHGDEYTECGDCSNMMCDCECGDYDEDEDDWDDDGGCRCNNEDGSCSC